MSTAHQGKPIAEISLPSHHPAVAGCKPGQHVMIHARRAPEPDADDMPMRMADGGKVTKRERPVPLTSSFHVMHIEPSKSAGKSAPSSPAKAGSKNPLEYLKEKQTKAAEEAAVD